ncbi:N-acetylmuramoyl-L-alanine amidase [Verrucomicrobium sp. GAS474]|uniref:N-acetylmuramoyl-L-alanine amidase family protein n=1 Tax=Verrucomicrobium sp. GAS474 TaxID=1882831 RepID=UPI00087A1B67|nr:N-acetylmuramoyl-L-alanine amidase [Verrucomicrobium sp. GAS474]SDU21746.1 N-acetylmuramoyl-L-alanine amidase [Verrucomicrobium sp. GAS474]
MPAAVKFKLRLLFLLLPQLFLLFPGLLRAENTSWHLVTRNHRDYLPLADFCAFYEFPSPTVNDNHRLSVKGPRGQITFEADSTRITYNGVCHYLSFPVLAEEGGWYVSRIDLAYFFEPLLRPAKIATDNPFKGVIIDPGHGGADNGAYSTQGGMEKTYTLDTAFRLERLLQSRNVTTVLTRRRDEFIPLEERARFGERYPDFLFVSIHFNSAGRGARGLETYAETPRGASSTSSEGSLRQSDFENVPGNEENPLNILLASSIHRRISNGLNPGDLEADRGVKRARFVVLKENPLPATLVEGGFLTNPLESRLIAQTAYRQKLAEFIADGIGDFLRSTKSPLAAAFRASFSEPNLEPGPPSSPPSAPAVLNIPTAPAVPEPAPEISTVPPAIPSDPTAMAPIPPAQQTQQPQQAQP